MILFKNVPSKYFIQSLRFILSFLILLILIQAPLMAQSKVSAWKTLGKVSMKTRQAQGYSIEYPVFSAEVKALEGKVILLRGYILPLDLDRPKQFIFSLFPYNTCYFCGAAGPETVIHTRSKAVIPYVDRPVWIRGRLRLNADDPEQMMYLLEDAVLDD